METLTDDTKLKNLFKQALMEALEEKKDVVRDLLMEAMEDVALVHAIEEAASELQLPEGLLASRKVLEALQDGSGWIGPLAGWRRTLLEPRLEPLL